MVVLSVAPAQDKKGALADHQDRKWLGKVSKAFPASLT